MPKPLTTESAEILGLEALGWLAGEAEALERFLKACGIEAADLREAAGRPETSAAVLDFLLRNEALLLQFCDDGSSSPAAVQAAWAQLERPGSQAR